MSNHPARVNFDAWKNANVGAGGLANCPEFVEALLTLLVDEEYGLTDVGLMFGVSRERVRQWAERLGIDTIHAGSQRVWDEAEGRFVTHTGRKHQTRSMISKNRKGHFWTLRHEEFGKILLEVQDKIGEVPTLADVGEHLGIAKHQIGPRISLRYGGGSYRSNGLSYTETLDYLWSAAGMKRPDGRSSLSARRRRGHRTVSMEGFGKPSKHRHPKYLRDEEQ